MCGPIGGRRAGIGGLLLGGLLVLFPPLPYCVRCVSVWVVCRPSLFLSGWRSPVAWVGGVWSGPRLLVFPPLLA